MSRGVVVRRVERQEGYKLRGTSSQQCYSITKLIYFWVLRGPFIQYGVLQGR